MKKKATNKGLEKHIDDIREGNEEKYRQFINNSFDMIVLLDAEGTQKYVSDSCIYILGYQPEELINIDVIEEMIHPEDQEKTREGLKGILDNKAYGGTQYRHKHKAGGWVYLEAYGTNQIENLYIQSVILNVRDITERKKTEKALQQSEARLRELNATKDRLFSIISHDLRNPFNSILGYSHLLNYQVQNKHYENLKKYAKKINEASHWAMELLENLLEWSRSQSGRIAFSPETITWKPLIEYQIKLFQDSAQQKAITFSNEEIPPGIEIIADEHMISTILRNLISNGIKFSHQGGNIHIRAEEKNDYLHVSVIDNGKGIEAENINKLFHIETNYSTKGTCKETGTGLGLLLCKEFVEKHKGHIGVESEPGKGSRFYFMIPVSD